MASLLLRSAGALILLPGAFVLLDRYGTAFGRDAAGLASSLSGLFAAFAVAAALTARAGSFARPGGLVRQSLDVGTSALGLAASWYLAGLLAPATDPATHDAAFWLRLIGRATAASLPFALCGWRLLAFLLPATGDDARPGTFDAVMSTLGGYAVTSGALVLASLVAFHGTGSGIEPLFVALALGVGVAVVPFLPAFMVRGDFVWWLAAATTLWTGLALTMLPATAVAWSLLLLAPATAIVLVRGAPWSWLGAVLAGPLAGALLLPRLDYATTLYAHVGLLALVYVVCAVVHKARPGLLFSGVVALALPLLVPSGGFARFPARDGWQTQDHVADLAGAVTLIEKPVQPGEPLRQRLVVDRRYTAGGALGFGERRLGHIPLLLQPGAKSALFLGIDSGVVPGVARTHGTLQRIDAVEPVAGLARLLPRFGHVNEQFHEDPRVRIRAGDPYRMLRAGGESYDVIVALPAAIGRRDAAAQFDGLIPAAAARHLAPGGLFVQWLPLDGADEPLLRRLTTAFLAAFPEAWACVGTLNADLPVLGLVGRPAGAKPATASAIEAEIRLNAAAGAYVGTPADLAACALLDTAALRNFASGAATAGGLRARLRWHPLVGQGGERLAGLLALTSAPPVAVDFGPAPASNVAARAVALRNYLSGDIGRVIAQDARAIEGYLGAFQADPSFEPSRAMLMLFAASRTNQTAAIFKGMLQATPDDLALRRMFTESVRDLGVRARVPLPPPLARPPAPPGAPR